MSKKRKTMFLIVILISLFILFIISFIFIGSAPRAEKISWGVNFSQKQAVLLGLDWRKVYLALLDDLKVKDIKLAAHWDFIENERDKYYFNDLDWQIEEAEKRNVKTLLVIGMKVPCWPECHIPSWAKNLNKEEQQKEILELIEKIVLRYRDSSTIEMWQVENEPFFPFGECPWKEKKFLEKEINLVKSLDNKKRPIVVSDSGEFSLWVTAARYGDIVGVTMYKKVWFKELKTYISYPFPPVFYWRKAQIIKKFFNKDIICVELQAEPWGPLLLYDLKLEEQEKSMNLERLKYNIEFAEKTGFDKFYLWGAEWWYWLKEKQNKPQIWQEVKKMWN